MKRVRTRYAPSPTGNLHIGGARTALFSYLYAKHFAGDFVVRIEDTDVQRNVENGEKSQLENLKWLGVIPDESPEIPKHEYGLYRQSEKIGRYREVVNQLLAGGVAYKAYDTPEELTKQREEQKAAGVFSFRYDPNWLQVSPSEKQFREENGQFVIRLKLPKNKVYSWVDMVRGQVAVNTNDIGDFVIMKKDGYPTYNLAVVVDDHDMEITHVLRGEEHITNTPKQLAIYEFLNWSAPRFGHLTIITNMKGKKLSKRDYNLKQFVEDYRVEQFASEAVFNFLALLGWSDKHKREIMTKEELIAAFDSQRFSKSFSKFDVKKMEWFSKEYIKNQENTRVLEHVDFHGEKRSEKWVNLFLDTYKESATTYKKIQRSLDMYLFPESFPQVKNEVVRFFWDKLKTLNFTVENIQLAINHAKSKSGKNGKDLFMPIRMATTNQRHGPELTKAVFLFGKKVIWERLG